MGFEFGGLPCATNVDLFAEALEGEAEESSEFISTADAHGWT